MSRRYVIEHPDESQDRYIVTTWWPTQEGGEEFMKEVLVGEQEVVQFVAEQLIGYDMVVGAKAKLVIEYPAEEDVTKTTIRITKPRPGVQS